MGTRAVTNVVSEKGEVYVSLYRQYDGYPQGGHGEELADWLEGAVIGNGIGSNLPPKFFNGVGDLAARLVTFFKEDHLNIGSFYLIPAGTDWGPDYTYTVRVMEDRPVELKVRAYDSTVFQGTVEGFRSWMEENYG